jgi:hypothetical protein
MIEVKVNLVPHGNRALTETLHTIQIVNLGTGNLIFGDYQITHIESGKIYIFKEYDRTLGALELVKEAVQFFTLQLGKHSDTERVTQEVIRRRTHG